MAILRSRKIAPQPHENTLQTLRRQACQQVSPKWDHHDNLPRFKAYGIANPGVLCYRNSLIQSLFHIPKFTNWLKFHHRNCRVSQCVACATRSLLEVYWIDGAERFQTQRNNAANKLQRRMTTRNTLIDFGVCGAWYRGDLHHDSSELWSYMYNAFKGQLSSEPQSDFLDSMFKLMCQRVRTCPFCDDAKEELDQQLELKLHFPNHKDTSQWTINQLIDHTFSPTTNAITDYRCEKCNNRGDFPIRVNIVAAPEVLIVQLVRYATHGHARDSTFSSARINAPVRFKPYMSTLTKYHVDNVPLTYQLVAVLQHLGGMANGHYLTVAMSPRGHWYRVEDEMVPQKVSFEEAVRGGFGKGPGGEQRLRGMVPYMLFYKRVVRQVADI
ncbi:hypothetical protein MMC14_002120 [Varicellaria rhodocarpa]|nr:hypothetical protein [Varicellaria rhodocarpa]